MLRFGSTVVLALRLQSLREGVFVDVVLVVEFGGGEATDSLAGSGPLHSRHLDSIHFLVLLESQLVKNVLSFGVHRVVH